MKATTSFFLAVVISLSGINSVFSQDTTQTIKMWTIYPGYVITHEDDTIVGYIKINNLADNQDKALFYKNADDPKFTKKYRPKDIKAYKVGPRFYESFKFWPAGGAANTYHFFLKVIDGPINYYIWYYEPESRTKERFKVDDDGVKIDLSFKESDLYSQEIVKKLDKKPEKIGLNFKKFMSKLVEDDKELADKILRKEEGYTFGNYENIINEYNTWYATTHR